MVPSLKMIPGAGARASGTGTSLPRSQLNLYVTAINSKVLLLEQRERERDGERGGGERESFDIN